MPKPRVALSWSGGKDAALALLRIAPTHNIQLLLTNLSPGPGRVTMHGIAPELIAAQAEELGLPLRFIQPETADNAGYEAATLAAYAQLKAEGIGQVVFGDIFLEDLRQYREALLQKAGLEGFYPLWKENTTKLANELLRRGISTRICAASDRWFTEEDAGALFSAAFLNQLPPRVDPCGENGEFHTFVTHHPMFGAPVAVRPGKALHKQYPSPEEGKAPVGFWFRELLPALNEQP